MKTTLLSLKAFFTICLLCLVGGVNAMAQYTETVDFSKQGYAQEEITSYTGTDFNITFSKGNGSYPPKYYTSGKAIRLYSDNTMTISSTTKKIKEITLTYTISNTTNLGFSTTSGSYNISSKKWTSDSGDGISEVTLTNKISSGHYKLKQLTVTFIGGTETPTINPASKTFSKSFEATISCTDAAAQIYYTLDGNTPDATSTLYTTGVTIPEATTTLKAVAIKDGTASKVAEALYTYEPPTYTYTIWSEDWSSFPKTEVTPNSGNNAAYTYGTGTKLYFGNDDKYAGGEVPELLIKSNTSFTIDVTSLKGYSGTLYFSFLTNKDKFTITSTTTGVNIGEPTIKGDNKYTYAIIVPEGTEGLNLKITNTAERDNMRVDDLSLSAKYLILGTDNFTITSAQYGTYYTEDAFVMPEGVLGYTITSEDGKTLNFNGNYVAGKTVPAKTALLLKATEKLTADKVYTYTIVNSTEVAPTDNLLHGSVAEAMTSVKDATAYYKLAQGEDGLGFYYGAENGGEFKNGAHKAYLAVTTEGMSKIRGFSFDSMTTGINLSLIHI